MPSLDAKACRDLFSGARHAHLATSGGDGWPHVVPVVLAVDGDRLVTAVDDKPKRTTNLRRLRNVRENERVAFLVDEYDEDWARLWWVRADALAVVLEGGPERDEVVRLLLGRYEQYRTAPPRGPVLVADVVRWTGWAASSPAE